MNEILNILTNEGNSIIQDIQKNLASTQTNATNKTTQSLKLDVRREGTKYIMRITGRPYFMTVETGRKPTPDKKPSRSMIENIREWVTARRLDKSLVWAIAMGIQKKGTKLWRKGGRKDIVSNVVNDTRIQQIERAFLEQMAKEFLVNVNNLFNGNKTANGL